MRLLFSRHGEAKNGSPDYNRELTDKGISEIKHIAAILEKMKVKPDYIVSSPLVRAKQTANLYKTLLGVEPEVIIEGALQPGGYIDDVVILAKSLNANMLFVGHQPDISGFVTQLTSPTHYNIAMFPGSLASVVFDGDIQFGRGYLEFLLRPF